MENKKLLKFIIKDLNELEELITEKGTSAYDEIEVEFLQSRISGAKKLVQHLYEREKKKDSVEPQPPLKIGQEEPELIESTIENIKEKEELIQEKDVEQIIEEVPPTNEYSKKIESESIVSAENHTIENPVVEETPDENTDVTEIPVKETVVEVEEKKIEDKIESAKNQRLGDSFSKEKSVNELLANESNNLGQKLSNRPLESIKSAIGINDRFQYIRELFNGNADNFANTVEKLDGLSDIKDAVAYLQQNFTWKENEVSLKFVNLVKRRFSNG